MLDLSDIQGNILRAYRSFVRGRFLFFRIGSPEGGRRFLAQLLPLVTRAEWDKRPSAAINVALNFLGLRALMLPSDSLASFPVAFQDGMKARAAALGDVGDSAPERWDEPWRSLGLHALVSVYAREAAALDEQCRGVMADLPEGIEALAEPQDVHSLGVPGESPRIEHFGFVDGLSNPLVEGVPRGQRGLVGNPDDRGRFRPVAAGEFIFGQPDEGGEIGVSPLPHGLARNGSLLVVRKLHQDVARFRAFVAAQAEAFRRVVPSIDADFVAAKMVGRWRDGSPLARYEAQPASPDPDNHFTYAHDPNGALCPLGAHIRRANPRDSLGFGGRLVNRRRLIRRGITYGKFLPHGAVDDGAPRGVMFLAFNTSIERQFEFIQQQWLNFGDELRQGNDMDPLTANQHGAGRMVIPGDEKAERVPLICRDIPRFVTMRGGDYFFVPGIAGLHLIAANEVSVQ
jgi:Dyp-type peroxidase family